MSLLHITNTTSRTITITITAAEAADIRATVPPTMRGSLNILPRSTVSIESDRVSLAQISSLTGLRISRSPTPTSGSPTSTGDGVITRRAFTQHTTDYDNPHLVTAEQVGAYTESEVNSLVNGRAAVPAENGVAQASKALVPDDGGDIDFPAGTDIKVQGLSLFDKPSNYKYCSMSYLHSVDDVQPIVACEADETWTNGDIVLTYVSNDATHVSAGKSSIKITALNGATAQATHVLASTLNWDYESCPTHELLVYVDDVTKLEQFKVILSTHASAPLTGAYANNQYTAPTVAFPALRTGWNLIRLDKSTFSLSGGFSEASWADIKTLMLIVKATTGNNINVWVSQWRTVHMRPVIMLDHDDGYADVEAALDIEEAYGLRSNNYVVTDWVGTAGFQTWPQLLARYRKGHDVCSHSKTHASGIWNVTTPDISAISGEVVPAWKSLWQRGFIRSARFFASPWGKNHANIRGVVDDYHVVYRVANLRGDGYSTMRYPMNRDIPDTIADQYEYSPLSVTLTPTFEVIKAKIDAAVTAGGLLILLSHRFDTGDDGNKVTTVVYKQVCQYLAELRDAGTIDVPTLSEFYDRGFVSDKLSNNPGETEANSAVVLDANGSVHFPIGTDIKVQSRSLHKPYYPPYHPETRPWYFDQMWKVHYAMGCLSNSDGTLRQGGEVASSSTLASSVSAGVTSITLAAGGGAKFTAKQLITLSNGPLDCQAVWIYSIVGDTLTVFPGIKAGGFASGTRVVSFWENKSHPTTYGHYILAYKLANAYRYECMTGFNILGSAGNFETEYPATNGADENGEEHMCVGWVSVNKDGFVAGRNSFVNGEDYMHYSRNAYAYWSSPSIASGSGIKTTVSMPVKAGETYVCSFWHRLGGDEVPFTVVDAVTPTTVIATNMFVGGQLTMHTLRSVVFTIPAGTTAIELRAIANGNNQSLNIDDVRIIRARDNLVAPRYLIEDPGDAPIVALGDSWMGGSTGTTLFTTLKYCIETRLGKTVNMINAGVPGDTLAAMNARFNTDVRPHYPKYCIAQFGANDVSSRTDGQNEADMDLFITNCRSNGIVPIIVGIPLISRVNSTIYYTNSTLRNDKMRARCDLITE